MKKSKSKMGRDDAYVLGKDEVEEAEEEDDIDDIELEPEEPEGDAIKKSRPYKKSGKYVGMFKKRHGIIDDKPSSNCL